MESVEEAAHRGVGRGGARDTARALHLALASGLLLLACVLAVALAARGAGGTGESVLEQAQARALTPEQQQLQTLEDERADKADENFQDHVSRQIKQLMVRAKEEEANADKEDRKGLKLDSKAKRTCKIAENLQNTDSGLEKRARIQREAATSLEGEAAVLTGEARKEEQLFQELQQKGATLRIAGQKLLTIGTELVSHAAALNITAHPHEKARATKDGTSTQDRGGEIVAKAHKIIEQANKHKENAAMLNAKAAQSSKAADAVLALGEKFEKRAVSHRLKTMTYRSKCTMIKAKAEAALRKGQDEAQNARVLHKIIKPAAADSSDTNA